MATGYLHSTALRSLPPVLTADPNAVLLSISGSPDDKEFDMTKKAKDIVLAS